MDSRNRATVTSSGATELVMLQFVDTSYICNQAELEIVYSYIILASIRIWAPMRFEEFVGN